MSNYLGKLSVKRDRLNNKKRDVLKFRKDINKMNKILNKTLLLILGISCIAMMPACLYYVGLFPKVALDLVMVPVFWGLGGVMFSTLSLVSCNIFMMSIKILSGIDAVRLDSDLNDVNNKINIEKRNIYKNRYLKRNNYSINNKKYSYSFDKNNAVNREFKSCLSDEKKAKARVKLR